jgi:hypothetical protein
MLLQQLAATRGLPRIGLQKVVGEFWLQRVAAMENRRGRSGNRRHDPWPFGLRLAAGALLWIAAGPTVVRWLFVR